MMATTPSNKAPVAHLDSAITKLMAFLKRDRKNSQALSVIFVSHDRAMKAKADYEAPKLRQQSNVGGPGAQRQPTGDV